MAIGNDCIVSFSDGLADTAGPVQERPGTRTPPAGLQDAVERLPDLAHPLAGRQAGGGIGGVDLAPLEGPGGRDPGLVHAALQDRGMGRAGRAVTGVEPRCGQVQCRAARASAVRPGSPGSLAGSRSTPARRARS